MSSTLVVEIIYLDLNAASELAISPTGCEFSKVREQLVEEVHKGSCICPMPLETIAEAAPCDRYQRIAIEEFFVAVSGGVAFRPHTDMIVNSTLALVRDRWPVSSFVAVKSGWATDEEFVAMTQADSEKTRERMTSRIADAQPPEEAEAMDVKKIFDAISAQRCGAAFRDMETFRTNTLTAISDYEIPWLMRGVISRGLSVKEADQLCHKIRYHQWTGITENYFDLRLTARWEHDRVHGHRPNYVANDEIDRWRAAVALSSSQLFITDKYATGLCHRSGVLDITDTTVLSIVQIDEFRAFLERINQ